MALHFKVAIVKLRYFDLINYKRILIILSLQIGLLMITDNSYFYVNPRAIYENVWKESVG